MKKISLILVFTIILSLGAFNVYALDETYNLTIRMVDFNKNEVKNLNGEVIANTAGDTVIPLKKGESFYVDIYTGRSGLEYIKFNDVMVKFGDPTRFCHHKYLTPQIEKDSVLEIKFNKKVQTDFVLSYPYTYKYNPYIYTFAKSKEGLQEYGIKVDDKYFKVENRGEDKAFDKASTSGMFGIGLSGTPDTYVAIPYVKNGDTEITGSPINVVTSEVSDKVTKKAQLPFNFARMVVDNYYWDNTGNVTSNTWKGNNTQELVAWSSREEGASERTNKRLTYFNFTVPEDIPSNIKKATLSLYLKVFDWPENQCKLRVSMPGNDSWIDHPSEASEQMDLGTPVTLSKNDFIFKGNNKLYQLCNIELDINALKDKLVPGKTISLYLEGISDSTELKDYVVMFGPRGTETDVPEITLEYDI